MPRDYHTITKTLLIYHIEAENGGPIYEQVERQVKLAIANRMLLFGERLPLVCQLAIQAAVTVNTVARAFHKLQQQDVLDSIRETDMSVSATAPEIGHRNRLEMVRQQLRSVLQQAGQNHISIDEVRSLVNTEWQSLPQPHNC